MPAILENAADAFAKAYGIRPDNVQRFVVVVLLLTVVTVAWPSGIRFAMRVTRTSHAVSSAEKPVVLHASRLTATTRGPFLEARLEHIISENRLLRNEMQAWMARLDANERVAAELKAVIEFGTHHGQSIVSTKSD